MFKSSMIKWAVAALLAVPAVPMFGKTLHHRTVTSSRTHRSLIVRSHRTSTRSHRRLSLAKRHKLVHRHSTKHTFAHKSAIRHTSMNTSSHFKVHMDKMPPTIDGINT
jgi:hypothetical protein